MTDLLEKMDRNTQETLQHVAASNEVNIARILKMASIAVQMFDITPIGGIDFPDLDLPRPPEEIKRDIKYERNPMRLKQLNRELNASYKYYKRNEVK